MSHNYTNRRTPSDSDHRPDRRRYSWSQESLSPSSSSRSLVAGPSSQDSVMNLLTSCGLEPKDLAVLAKLPEDVLTVESLPGIIQQIKGKDGTLKPCFPPSSFSTSHCPPNSFTSGEWDHLRRQPVQYPFQRIPSTAPPPEPRLDFQGGHMTIRSVRSPPSSSSRAAMDTDHRPRPSQHGKVISSCSRVSPKKEPRPSRFSDSERTDYRSIPPAGEFLHCTPPGAARSNTAWAGTAQPSATRADAAQPNVARPSGARPNASGSNAALPSQKQAKDFHGVLPLVYPYSCALCDITVLSEKVWTNHINSGVHADGQLRLLQQFPNWDCRVETFSRGDDQSGREKDEESPAPSAQTTSKSQAAAFHSSKKLQKTPDRGRVVCVKFPAQTVDEAYLRNLIEPFGKIGKVLMFPSVAFVELGSSDQAKDLIKFYINSDAAVKKKRIEFSISNTFSFLQSSQVVSFNPTPRGKDGFSDLISIIRRFGEPLYTLFLPSKAFVEMKFSADAQKLVHYYSSNTLRINNDSISVSFSSEYKSLMRVSLAQRYEEESAKNTTNCRESSREQRTRSRSKDRSRTRSNREQKTRSRSRSRSRSITESGDKSCQDLRSRSKERSSSSSLMQNQSEEKSDKPDMETRSGADPKGVSIKREPDEEQMDSEDGLSAEESDIEGMEVIAEDGENVKDEDEESLEEEEEEPNSPEEENKSPERGEEEVKNMEAEKETEEEVKHTEADEEEKLITGEEKTKEQEETGDLQEDKEGDFPLDLEACITLDEVDCDDEGGPAGSNEPKVFMEMSTPAEILREKQLWSKPVLSASSNIRTSGTELRTCDVGQTSSWSRERNESTKTLDIKTEEMPEKVPELSDDLELRMGSEEEPVLGRTSKKDSTSRKGSKTRTGRREGTPKDDPVPLKVQETKSEGGTGPTQEPPEESSLDREHQSAGVCLEDRHRSEPPEQDPEMDQQSEHQSPEPTKPIGVEFVRPVVGYFCNLCQLIFSDEDEAKLQHCSTLEHHRKYQEKMGQSLK